MTTTPTTPSAGAATPQAPQTFDITGPLPTGTTLLEASAGTGKTWTIAALVTRYVAQGVATLDQLLVVTFTRAASQELRERVRAQLTDAARVLAEPDLADPANRLHDWLLDVDDAGRAERLALVTQALTGFDAATIATIHQFCQLVLRSLGVAGDTDRDAVLVEDLELLTDEVVDDLYLARFATEQQPPWGHDVARRIARAVVGDPRARVEPAAALEAPDSEPAARVRFACDVLAEVDRRKRRLGILSYDDLLGQLADALAEPGSPARLRMQQRWKVALIDEFQDTDPVQWQVFERAFHGSSTLVLIGDPKQAIYAFRGGDVVTYLQAAEVATTRQTLGTNWRADRPLLDSLHAVLQGAELGDPRIVVHPVEAHHPDSRLEGAGAPFRMRLARRHELGAGPRSKPSVDRWREHVITDMAHDVKRLLTSGATWEGRPLVPGDVAVLAARRADLQAAQHALADVGVPSVVNAGGSVFHTPAATEWLALLEALEQPHRTERVRGAALTCFLGVTAAELDAGGTAQSDQLTDELSEQVRVLADVLAKRGVAAVLECAVLDGLTERVLSRLGGERLLTDVRHIGEALHKVSVEQRLGAVGLVAWLRDQVADEKLEVASERTRRLDSDAAAVQLVTIHGSKGLEYPVVYAPTLWNRWTGTEPEVPLFHDDDGQRCRDVGGRGQHRAATVARHWSEDAGESLRLLYVTLTRAKSQVVAWYAPTTKNTSGSALHRMLLGRRPGGSAVPDDQPLVEEERLVQIFGHWRDAGGFQPELASSERPDDTPLLPSRERLAVRSFTRSVDTDWRRTSYSALSAAAGTGAAGGPGPAGAGAGAADAGSPGAAGAGAGSLGFGGPGSGGADGTRRGVRERGLAEPEEIPEMEDAVQLAELGILSAEPEHPELAAVPSPMAHLPIGATFGSLVHAVLEHADPAAPYFRAHLVDLVEEHRVWWPVELDAGALADALVTVCASPLGPLAGDVTWMDLPLRDRLAELDFEVPLVGGDQRRDAVGAPGPSGRPDRPPSGRPVRLGDLAPLLRRHLPAGDPLLGYADTLEADPALAGQVLRGYLTGSIDVVLRVPVDGATRYLTVDYKTNWLGDTTAPLTAHSYRPAVLAEAMGHSDYPLQALLYTVVLHRYLRWRLPGYDPEQHLGGVLYLYLRGMCGPDTPRVDGEPCGVFAWRPPVPLVEELSALLDGVTPTTTSTVPGPATGEGPR
ncbi:UvrD-helicase domain-containing protein [Nocardioides solisilvae]|uniref:UvrD-helicase domain-containing protein n=1 Tax=Nocardioides solisilvae TaxID=1542435 RepID=UPI001EF415D7|nr:UvrD-helicase domain-containing protein [Nocardioides solisilvae]